jgi:hypothetical protein
MFVAAPSVLAAQQVITSSGPLTNIYLNDNLGCQVKHAADAAPSFFGGTDPGSCGTFIAVPPDPVTQTGTTVYGSRFTAYGLVVQSGVSGSGSSGDPFVVTTVVDAGSSGLRITQTDSYVVGQEFYRTDIDVSNSSSSVQTPVLYHAADCFLQDSDSGYGFYDSSTGGIFCSANPHNSPAARVLGFVPAIGSDSHYYEDFYSEVYGAVNGSNFPDRCECDVLQDNGAGLSWSITVPPNGSVRRSLATAVSPTGAIPNTQLQQQPQQPAPGDTTPPETAVVTGPPALSEDNTPTFSFSSSEAGSSFECSLDGGPFVACSSPHTTARLRGGRHTLSVRAIDAAGNVDPSPTVYTFEIAMELSELPAPSVGQRVNVDAVKGTVLVAVPAQGAASGRGARASQKGLRYVPLEQARQVPVGSYLDTKRGTVKLVSATGSGKKTQSGNFSKGVFQIRQKRTGRERGLTDLRLTGGNFNRCNSGRAGSGAASAARRKLSKKTIRRLNGNADGDFRSSGKHAAGTTRGTRWETIDRCDGTLIKVKRGKISVRDLRRKRTITVRAGKSYLARAPS